MYPRWRSDDPGPRPSLPENGGSSLGQTRQNLFAEPHLDLEQQLSAELSGASWAVVAFAPEDAAWCDWIYRSLNGYPLPASLIDRVTPHGFPRPDCLSIFPDLRDPAYQEHVNPAIENSAYLIVVCSPKSARASVVDENIRAFKKAGGEERIIAFVVDGPPDARLGEHERAADFEWLPAWLRWRCDEKGFCPAGRDEPRVIEGRRGFASLQQVRDALLAAVVDLEAGELEQLGAFKRALPELPEPASVPQPTMPPSFPTNFPSAIREPAAQRDVAFMIGTAVALIVVAVIFGLKSFRELSADEPQSALAMTPRSQAQASHGPALPPVAVVEHDPVVPIANVDSVLDSDAPFVSPEAQPAPRVAAPVPVPVAAPQVSVSQVAPAPAGALTRVQAAAPVSAIAVTAVTPVNAGTSSSSTTDDAVLLDEVKTLERRGDEIMAERRTEDALDLYTTALSSAIEYANRKGANPAAKDQVVMLQRKLGILQLQNASTAEARTSYQQARKTLLQLKQQGAWNTQRGKALDEMESRLLSLPRD